MDSLKQETKKLETPLKEIKKLETITNSIGMTFVLIPSGNFMMGSDISPKEAVRRYGHDPEMAKKEHPRHYVKIRNPFYLQITPVTQGHWKSIMEENPSYHKIWGDDMPVELVSWDDAQDLIEKLNELEGVTNYRLPSEAEWEYACRAGNTTKFAFGKDSNDLKEYAWVRGNSSRTQPVGTRKPNVWGLYDMLGNVYEWIEDDYHHSYDGAPDDGTPWIDHPRGGYRVLRGDSYGSAKSLPILITYRGTVSKPDARSRDIGLRLAKSVST